MAARRVVAFPSKNNGLNCPTGNDRPLEYKRENPFSSSESGPKFGAVDPVLEMENPGALAGATGAELEVTFRSEAYRNRYLAAKGLCAAIAECEPVDACEIMQAALASMALPMPGVPFVSLMDEATFWAGLATRRELKAYVLACFDRLSGSDRNAFLGYVQGRAAA